MPLSAHTFSLCPTLWLRSVYDSRGDSAERLDAGVRVGDQVAKDMIAMRISPDFNMTVVGSPSYFAAREVPVVPQDLTEHSCINLRLPTHGGLYAWEFEKEGQELSVRVQGQVILNTSPEIVTAALEGYGLAYIPQDVADQHIEAGHLVQVLEDWRPTYPGYHLYYPSRRNASPAFLLVLDALRLKA
ncbi:LysR substrate-binding domain-containing protein [Massilia orientalis]|uniref:LysR substrate-binding domain-containing protein n=1 Tax=Massilia orientalis TaxID=3050128 RepID=A0ACC7ML55_9BURK